MCFKALLFRAKAWSSWAGASWNWESRSEEARHGAGSAVPWSGIPKDLFEDNGDFEADLPEVFPNTVPGWLVLQKSGLDNQEKGTTLVATKNSTDLGGLESAMKAQWTDDEYYY